MEDKMMLELYLSGVPVKEIAQEFGLAVSTTYRLIAEAKEDYSIGPLTGTVLSLHGQGVSVGEIAAETGLEPATITKLITVKTGLRPGALGKTDATSGCHMHDHRDASVVAAYETGWPIKNIVAEFGVSPATIYGILKKYDVPTNRKKPITKDDKKQIIAMYTKTRKTVNSITKAIDCTPQTVYNILREADIEPDRR
jgi:transposase-like protein